MQNGKPLELKLTESQAADPARNIIVLREKISDMLVGKREVDINLVFPADKRSAGYASKWFYADSKFATSPIIGLTYGMKDMGYKMSARHSPGSEPAAISLYLDRR